jgi:hypothetical protein
MHDKIVMFECVVECIFLNAFIYYLMEIILLTTEMLQLLLTLGVEEIQGLLDIATRKLQVK